MITNNWPMVSLCTMHYMLGLETRGTRRIPGIPNKPSEAISSMIKTLLRRITLSLLFTMRLAHSALLFASNGAYLLPSPHEKGDSTANCGSTAQRDSRAKALNQELGDLKTLLRIPGMSAAVVSNGRIAWVCGYG